jgi:gluconolactonase
MTIVASAGRIGLLVGLASLGALSPLAHVSAQPAPRSIERLDPALDALIAPDARIELLADGFDWTEGPVWQKGGGYLLFSDIPRNTIHRWKEGQGVSVYMRPAGYAGSTPFGRELGSNGLTFDPGGELVMADHGNRQVSRVDSVKFTKTVLADRYNGSRLNSPNDLVFNRAGDLFFTDPPYGLSKLNDDPAKELDFNGVYRLSHAGALTLLTRALTFPNGIALSPDERTLYVAVSDPARPIWMAYEFRADGSLTKGHVFFDASALAKAGRQGLPDGMKVDAAGNVFASGPGGILVFSPSGKHLGTIATGETTANCAFGDDGMTLYMTANHTLMRVRLRTKGPGF